MSRISLFVLMFLFLVVCFSREQQGTPAGNIRSRYQSAEKIFREANRLSDEAGDNELEEAKANRLYFQSMLLYYQVQNQALTSGHDSIAFFSCLRTAYINFILDSTQSALHDYDRAFRLKERLPAIPDSFLFEPLIYTGGMLRDNNNFDSSLYCYKRAESINDQYPKPLAESQRLFNRLGVMYYETGNYQNARIYFEKALSLTPLQARDLRANYQANIASLLVKLDELDEARSIYLSLLPLHLFTNEIHHNLGIISLRKKDYSESVQWLSRVNYSDKKNIDLFYNRAMAFSGLGQEDSSARYFHQALAENRKWNGHQPNTSLGLLLKFQADELAQKKQFKESLTYYQQALMQFDRRFSDPDINHNPEEFIAVYSYINLFNTLIAKAEALENIYRQDNDIRALAASLYAYRSAFKLADYVERTFNSDEARLFLVRIKHEVHGKPMSIGIQLFRLTQKKEYLEEVYYFDQRNKASLLSLNIHEQELKEELAGSDKSLFKAEADARSAITRLSIQAASQTDSLVLTRLDENIRDKEIELDKIREKINSNPGRQERLAAERIPPVVQLQRQLDNSSAILSYHLSDKELLILLITSNRFEYFESSLSDVFDAEIRSFQTALYHPLPGERYTGIEAAQWLYSLLITPVLPGINQLKRLVIIPDDELNYLPFEALQDGNKHYLFEKFAIQYQYSTALLGNKSLGTHYQNMLSFAPFSGGHYRDSTIELSRLPLSGEEVKGIPGIALLDSQASKKNFLQQANRKQVLHLATHAIVNNEHPDQSYISFYPGNRSSRLYAGEIYNLQLDTTRLIVLSACETGSGPLVKGEGMMSLSRAFAYAGCPNIITSLWKAEDRATAFITQRLYYYLGKNETTDKALQQAKSDFLKSPDIDPSLKTPNYWAHLILIGEYIPDHKRNNWPWVAISMVVILLSYYLLKKRKLPAGNSRQ